MLRQPLKMQSPILCAKCVFTLSRQKMCALVTDVVPHIQATAVQNPALISLLILALA